jgi:2-phospho-L-lactate guanylyltransferase
MVAGRGSADVAPDRRRCGVVVPVKPRRSAKSRLAPLGDELRRALTTAMALDTVAAAVACPAVGVVLVVTDDVALADLVRAAGADAVPDGRPGDLNASLWQGAAELERRRPGVRPVALCGDLPCLRPDDLAAVLRDAAAYDGPAFVADAAGVGTTCYTAPDLAAFAPAFGGASRSAHVDLGAVEVGAAAPTVRRDVDTPADLGAARALGLGVATATVLDGTGAEGACDVRG